MLITLYIRKI